MSDRNFHYQPKNADSFKKILKCWEKVEGICNFLGIKPIVYGSLAYFYHTKDTNIEIRDIDMLLPEAVFPQLMHELQKEKRLIYKLMPYQSIEIFQDGVEIDLDSRERFLGQRSRKSHKVMIGNTEFSIINIQSLISVYEEAIKNMPEIKELAEKRKNYSEKLRRLQEV